MSFVERFIILSPYLGESTYRRYHCIYLYVYVLVYLPVNIHQAVAQPWRDILYGQYSYHNTCVPLIPSDGWRSMATEPSVVCVHTCRD